MTTLPENLVSLHAQEEELRAKALALVAPDTNLILHIAVVEQAMNLGDLLRKFPTDDEDLKVAQILGMRMFNAFGASLKLALSGYHQNAALILRDIMETVFLLDLFSGDRTLIAKWRFADAKTLRQEFSPAAVRKALSEASKDIYQRVTNQIVAELEKGVRPWLNPWMPIMRQHASPGPCGRTGFLIAASTY